MAVITMCVIAVLAAIGTFVEAKLGLDHAQRLVYRSWWMISVMILFMTNLTAVIVDRWPWQKKHASFICAHVGIIFIILGQWVGNTYGLDGMLTIPIGSESKSVVIADTEIQIYSSFDAQNYSRIHRQDVDFIKNPPSEENPVSFKLGEEELKFVDYKPFVIPKRDIVPTDQVGAGRAVRFQLKNAQTQAVEWLYQRSSQVGDQKPLGPLMVTLGPLRTEWTTGPQLHMEFQGEKLVVTTYAKGSLEPSKRWIVEEGQSLPLDWMGFELKFLRILPQAREALEFSEREGPPTELTVAATKVRYKNQEHWILENDTLKIFSEYAVYIVAYGKKRVELNFPVKLINFEKQNYQGIAKAMAYQSVVTVPGVENHVISMNEPLKYQGLTFYQASFQQDDTGRAVASVLSVNYDPGRFLKYFGSLIMSIGILLLFYFRKKWSWSFLKKSP